MATITNQWWISIRNIIIYLESKFRPNRKIFVFGGHFVPWLPWQRPPFWICSTPKAATYYGGYSYKAEHNMAPKPWISIPNIKIYLETKFRPNRRIFVPWLPWQRPPFWIFPTPKAATHYGWYSYKVSWRLMKGFQIFFKSPLFCFHGNCGKVCPIDSDCFSLSLSTSCGCCSYQVSSISFRRVTCYDHFCVFQFFSILAVSMATAAILKIPKVVCTSTHSA